MGTPAYIAPEVLSRREYDGKVSPEQSKSDATRNMRPAFLFRKVMSYFLFDADLLSELIGRSNANITCASFLFRKLHVFLENECECFYR